MGPAVDWSRSSRWNPPGGVERMWADLIALRRNLRGCTGGLRGDGVRFSHVNHDDKVLCFHRWHRGGCGDDVMVLVNLSSSDFDQYAVGVPRMGLWNCVFTTADPAYCAPSGQAEGEISMSKGESSRAVEEARDGFPFLLQLPLGPYSALVLSQQPRAVVRFKVTLHTQWGDHVVVCGADQALGEWDWSKSVSCGVGGIPGSYPDWYSTPVNLPALQDVQFKVGVFRPSTGQFFHEEGENRVLNCAAGLQTVQCSAQVHTPPCQEDVAA